MCSYFHPLIRLTDHWILKTLLSILATIYAHDPQMVVVTSLLIALDFGTGLWAAYEEGGLAAITSGDMRRTVKKIIQYVILLSAVGWVAKTYGMMAWSLEFCYALVGLTELTSVIENISREGGVVYRIWMRIRNRVEEIILP